MLESVSLKGLLLNAKQHVPFYSELLSSYTLPDFEAPYDILHRLPISTKHDLQKQYENMISISVPRRDLLAIHTGGSTGKPLSFLVDRQFLEKRRAANMRNLTWGGWTPGEPIAMFWGAEHELGAKPTYLSKLKTSLTGWHLINSHQYDHSLIRSWIGYLVDNNIKFVYGYSSVIYNIARYQRRHGTQLPKMKAIFTTAETLFPHYRQLIEDTFQCKVYNQYGSREVPSISAECEKGNMHILSDMVHAEFMHGSRNDNIYRIILTSFINHSFPFIRYDIEDLGLPKAGDCSCGRIFPLMEITIGRARDHMVKPDGQIIHPSYFSGLLYGAAGIMSYQFRQIDHRRIVLFIVPDDSKSVHYSALEELRARIQRELSWEVSLDIQQVDHIPTPSSGKHRYVVSDLSLEEIF